MQMWITLFRGVTPYVVFTNVSENHIIPNFRLEVSIKMIVPSKTLVTIGKTTWWHNTKTTMSSRLIHKTNVFFPVPVCAITASGVPRGTLVSMNRSSTLCG
jgi:hypothetical protein